MTNLGTFTAGSGCYVGTLETLTLTETIVFEPLSTSSTKSAKSPDFRIFARDGRIEVGAAWNRTSNKGTSYLSVVIDDPSFYQAISARLLAGDNGEYRLVWNR